MLTLLALLVRNSGNIFLPLHDANNPRHSAALALEAAIGPDDLIVCDGWDHSVLYMARNPRRPHFGIMQERGQLEGLRQRIAASQAEGARVFFFGLLELTPEEWAANTVGDLAGHTYHEVLNAYKTRSKLVWEGGSKGFVGDLYELDPLPRQ